jgi:hypothetical protein
MSTTTQKVTLTLTLEQVEMLKQVLGQVVKPSKASSTGEKKPKRKGSLEKGVTPGHLVKWNAYVDLVEAELKATAADGRIDAVWDEWAATNPVSKKDGSSKATAEKREKFKVIRQIAMAIAKARKMAGSMPAEYEHTPMTAEEKAAAKAAREAAKAAESSATESATESATSEGAVKKKTVVRKPKVKAVVAAPEPAPCRLPSLLPPTPRTVAPAPAPAATDDEDDDESVGVTLEPWRFKGKMYQRVPNGDNTFACWNSNADGSRGRWAGQYSTVKDKIDSTVPEPEFDE